MKQEDSKFVTEVKPTNKENNEPKKKADRLGHRNNVASKVEGLTGCGQSLNLDIW